MHVQVEHGLPGFRAAVNHSAEAREALLPSHLGGHQQQMAKQLLVLLAGLRQVHHVLARDHQHMHRRLRRHIAEGEALLIGIHLIAGDLATQDAAEDRVIHRLGGGLRHGSEAE